MELYGDSLESRLGFSNWKRRIDKEAKLNPAKASSYSKAEIIAFHRTLKSCVSLALRIIGKRNLAIENCFDPVITQSRIEIPKAFNANGFRMLHLSDFHLDTHLHMASVWRKMIESIQYDVVVITGDFYNGYKLPNKEEWQVIQELIESIKRPIFAILGNHDSIMLTPALEALGVRVLLNEVTEWRAKGLNVTFAGTDDPHRFKSDDLEQIATQLAFSDPSDLRIMLTHAPAHTNKIANLGFDICLCGHTHGGQLCTPNGIPLLRNLSYPLEQISGNWKMDSMAGFTSRGTGTGKLHYRLHCPPEIVLHEVVPVEKDF
jgi:predicted MPP superfamily phosphohydrolase